MLEVIMFVCGLFVGAVLMFLHIAFTFTKTLNAMCDESDCDEVNLIITRDKDEEK